MTDVVYTRAFDTDDSSSVIDCVYYSEPEKLLFVELVNGVLAGYKDVPLNVFTALDTINTNRLNGDLNESVGRYWNLWIKPNFSGYDTSDIDLLSEADVARQERLRNLMTKADGVFVRTPQVYESFYRDSVDLPNATILPVDPPAQLSHFGVTIEDDDEGETINLTVLATDMDDAIDRYRQAEKILGWDEAVIVSVTKFFD